jgi:hypothetical protein
MEDAYELGLHGWDMRASVDAAAELRPGLCPFLVPGERAIYLLVVQKPCELTCRFHLLTPICEAGAGGQYESYGGSSRRGP